MTQYFDIFTFKRGVTNDILYVFIIHIFIDLTTYFLFITIIALFPFIGNHSFKMY